MCFVWMKHSIELICDFIWILICGDSVECIGVNRIKSHFQTIKLDWEKKKQEKMIRKKKWEMEWKIRICDWTIKLACLLHL